MECLVVVTAVMVVNHLKLSLNNCRWQLSHEAKCEHLFNLLGNDERTWWCISGVTDVTELKNHLG